MSNTTLPLRSLFKNGEFVRMGDKVEIEQEMKDLESTNIEDTFDIQRPIYCICGTPHPEQRDMEFCGCREDYH